MQFCNAAAAVAVSFLALVAVVEWAENAVELVGGVARREVLLPASNVLRWSDPGATV